MANTIILPKLPMTLPQGIAREEGYYIPNSRAQRNNNPGNIEFGKFAIAHGATRVEADYTIVRISVKGRFAYFPIPEEGFAALEALLRAPAYYDGTIKEAIYKWAPPTENSSDIYLHNICVWVMCEPDDRVETILNR